MSSRTTTRIAGLLGGPTAGRGISFVLGRDCASALHADGYQVSQVDAGESLCRGLRVLHPGWTREGMSCLR